MLLFGKHQHCHILFDFCKKARQQGSLLLVLKRSLISCFSDTYVINKTSVHLPLWEGLGNFANIAQDFLYLVARLLLVGRKLLARHPIYLSYGYSFFNMKFPIFMKYLFFLKMCLCLLITTSNIKSKGTKFL